MIYVNSMLLVWALLFGAASGANPTQPAERTSHVDSAQKPPERGSEYANESAILGFHVVKETHNTLILDVEYRYNGEHGSLAFASVAMAIDGNSQGARALARPLKSGIGKTRIALQRSGRRRPLTTNQLQLYLYGEGGKFVEVFKPYHKTWTSRPDAAGTSSAVASRPAVSEGRAVSRVPQTRPAIASQAASRPVEIVRLDSDPTEQARVGVTELDENEHASALSASEGEEVKHTASPYVHWAVLATPEVEQSGLPDLLTVALSQRPELRVVERSEIQKTTNELIIGQLVTSEAVVQRLKLGRQLKADVLIVLAEETGKHKRKLLRVVICETQFGARLHLDSIEGTTDARYTLINTMVSQIRARYPSGVRWIIAVPPFVSRNLTHDYDPLRARFAHVLESALAVYPGTAVLEIEEAQAIRRELDLTSETIEERLVPVFVAGEFRIERADGHENIAMKVDVTRASGSTSADWDLGSIKEAVEVLTAQAPSSIMSLSQTEFLEQLSTKRQIELLGNRADVFARRGEFLPSISLRESALLVDPDHPQQNLALLNDLLAIVPYKGAIIWSRFSEDKRLESLQERAELWKRSVSILEHAIRKRLIDRAEGVRLVRQVRSNLANLMRNSGHRRLWDGDSMDEQIVAQARSVIEACNTEYRRIVRDLIPLIGGLTDARESTAAPDNHKPIGRDLFALAMSLRYEEPNKANPLNAEDLEHFAHVMVNLAANVRLEDYYMVLRLFRELGTNPDYRRDFTNEEFLRFLSRLKTSDSDANRLLSRLGHILYDYRYGREGVRADSETTLRAVEEWLGIARGTPGLGIGIPAEIRSLRKALQPLNAGKDVTAPLPPRVDQIDTEWKYEISLKEMEFLVHGKPEVSEGPATTGGWRDLGGQPDALVPAGTFDIFWNWRSIWIQRRPNELQEIVTAESTGNRFHDVAWDGQSIWVLTAVDGLAAYAPDGTLLVRGGQEDGLPPATWGGKVASLSPGRVVVVGSLGVRNRAWCANVELKEERLAIDVFHEATLARDSAGRDGVSGNDPRVTFLPYWLYRAGDYQKTGEPLLLLSCAQKTELLAPRRMRESYVLWVLPHSREVHTANFPLAGGDRLATRRIYHFLENGDCLLAYGRRILHWTAPANRKGNAPAVQILHENKNRDDMFCGEMFVWKGYIYAPGSNHLPNCTWVRVHPETLAVDYLGEAPTASPYYESTFYQFGVSGLLGLLAWDNGGHVYQIDVHPKRSGHQADPSVLARFDQAIASAPNDEMPWRRKATYLYQVGALDQARGTCLAWIESQPRSLTARFALKDIQKKLLSGLGVFEYDDRWCEYPYATFGAWRVFNDPHRGGYAQSTLMRAVQLSAFSNDVEWHIAEIGLYDAADLMYGFERYHSCIDICDRWEEASKARKGADASYLALRAAARLKLGRFDAALTDAKAARERETSGWLWAGKSNELLDAINSRDTEYVYRCNEPRNYSRWMSDVPTE